jgi:hypothetical protein
MGEMTSLAVKRHYSELSQEETDELVGAMADLIVDFLKRRRDPQDAAESSNNEGLR